MVKRMICIVLALCAMLMLCAAQPASAATTAWADLYFGLSKMMSPIMLGSSGAYLEYPLSFTLEGVKMTLPCRLSAFLTSGWEIYDSNTGDYLARYELVEGFCERELLLRKNKQELSIAIRNPGVYNLEMMDCDVERIMVCAFSDMDTRMPDIESYGIRPRGSADSLPKWLKQSSEFIAGDTEYSVHYDEEYGSVFAWISTSGDFAYMYYSLDNSGRVDYFAIAAQNN